MPPLRVGAPLPRPWLRRPHSAVFVKRDRSSGAIGAPWVAVPTGPCGCVGTKGNCRNSQPGTQFDVRAEGPLIQQGSSGDRQYDPLVAVFVFSICVSLMRAGLFCMPRHVPNPATPVPVSGVCSSAVRYLCYHAAHHTVGKKAVYFLAVVYGSGVRFSPSPPVLRLVETPLSLNSPTTP